MLKRAQNVLTTAQHRKTLLIFSSESLQMSFCMLSGDQSEEKASTSWWCKQCTGREATRLLDGWGSQPKCNHSTTPTQQERQMLHMTPTANTTNVHEPCRSAARRHNNAWQITTNYIVSILLTHFSKRAQRKLLLTGYSIIAQETWVTFIVSCKCHVSDVTPKI